MTVHWKVIESKTGEEVQPDQVITDIHGGSARYRRLLRGPSDVHAAVVEVFCPNEGCPSERYAFVFGLKVIVDDDALRVT